MWNAIIDRQFQHLWIDHNHTHIIRSRFSFNKLVSDAEERDEPIQDPMYSYTTELAEGESIPTLSTLPNIVVVVDELADKCGMPS
jgi:DNA segregation ATPase FtsK/SpoIIIE-like protein